MLLPRPHLHKFSTTTFYSKIYNTSIGLPTPPPTDQSGHYAVTSNKPVKSPIPSYAITGQSSQPKLNKKISNVPLPVV